MKTKDRIVDTARQLFNDDGTAAVSTNHIASAAGISPGNLYYHFNNKEEIIQAIFERLNATWDALFTLPSDQLPTLNDLQHLVHQNFVVLWDYRFFYRELIVLLRRDAVLQRRYHEVRMRGFADFQQLFHAFVVADVLLPPDDPATVSRLATLCWLVSEFWLPMVELSGESVDAARIQEGVELMMQILRPYLVSHNPSNVSGG